MGDRLMKGLGVVLGVMLLFVFLFFGSVGIGFQPLRSCERNADHYCTTEGGGHGR